jgi:superfamily II DNA or RNA helicase
LRRSSRGFNDLELEILLALFAPMGWVYEFDSYLYKLGFRLPSTVVHEFLLGIDFGFSLEGGQFVWNYGALHQRTLALVQEHEHQVAAVAKSIWESLPGQNRWRVGMYCPALWQSRHAMNDVYYDRRRQHVGWDTMFAEVDPEFVTGLTPLHRDDILLALAPKLTLNGGWAPSYQTTVSSSSAPQFHSLRSELALMSGNELLLASCFGASFKRNGYQSCWDFLQGRTEEAYLSFCKAVSRRKLDAPAFSPFVALFARLAAYTQGDMLLFQDPRFSLPLWPDLNEFLDLCADGVAVSESQIRGLGLVGNPGSGLGLVVLHLFRQIVPQDCRPSPQQYDRLRSQGLEALNDQVSDQPQNPWLVERDAEEDWKTLLRLLSSQAELVKDEAPSSETGALFWHLVPPTVAFYQDLSALEGHQPTYLEGRRIDSKTLLNKLPEYLSPRECHLLGKVRLEGRLNQVVLSAELLRALIGHSRVYYEHRRRDLVERCQYLWLSRAVGGFKIEIKPEIPVGRDYLFELEDRDTLVFWTRSPVERQLGGILACRVVIPESAASDLRRALTNWLPKIEVRSAKGLPPIQEVSLEADRLVLRIRPQASLLRFDWVVRCSQLKDYSRPATKGQSLEKIQEGGQSCTVVRNIAWEHREIERHIAGCPALPIATEFRSESLEEAMTILTQCREMQVPLEWPVGQEWKIRPQIDSSRLRVRVQKNLKKGALTDWFSLDGHLEVDAETQVELAQLLANAKIGQGEFLQLGEQDFVRIDQQLRAQLDRLVDLVDSQPGGLALSGLSIPTLASLELSGLSCDQAYLERLESYQQAADYIAGVPNTLQAELRDYQVEGFQWLARHVRSGSGACLADDMGLGKTLQVIALMLLHRSDGPHLVVCPVSVAGQWAEQLSSFAPSLNPILYEGTHRILNPPESGDVLICSYAVMQRDHQQLMSQGWYITVLDEAQAIKNPESKTARAAFVLSGKVRIVLTGTPVENRLSELWSLFAFLNPGLFGTLATFRRKFEATSEGKTRAKLRSVIAPFVLRRLKSQVLSELPARTEMMVSVQLSPTERVLYEEVRQEAREMVESGNAMKLLGQLTRLRQACCHPALLLKTSNLQQSSSKIDVLLELVESLRGGNHRALVFSQFTSLLDLVETQLQHHDISYLRLDGTTSSDERRLRVQAFQSGQGELFLISLKAGGSGLNLTAADYVIHLDPWWNPAAEDQASDRAHRIGQTRPVTIYRLIAEQTIEEKVLRLHGEKRKLAESVLHGQDVAAALNVSELRQLLSEA